jgi:hypothetical protein
LIYFVQSVDGGPIKIGVSIRLSERLKQLEKEAGRSLRVLGVIPGGRLDEQTLHYRFSRLRTEGEWFNPGESLLDFIRTKAVPWDGIDESPVRQLFAVKGCLAWYRWLKEFSGSLGMTPTEAIDASLREQSKRDGFELPMPDRL